MFAGLKRSDSDFLTMSAKKNRQTWPAVTQLKGCNSLSFSVLWRCRAGTREDQLWLSWSVALVRSCPRAAVYQLTAGVTSGGWQELWLLCPSPAV